MAERRRQFWQMAGREDPRYLGQRGDGEFYFHQVIPAIEEWSQSYTTWEVAEKLTEIGFSMGIAQTIADLAQCPHLEARKMFVETGDTLCGQFRTIRTPLRLTGCEDFSAETPPKLGEHNREILCGIGGLAPEELSHLESEGAL